MGLPRTPPILTTELHGNSRKLPRTPPPKLKPRFEDVIFGPSFDYAQEPRGRTQTPPSDLNLCGSVRRKGSGRKRLGVLSMISGII